MTLFRTSGPDVEPVTLADAKAELRIDHDSEDDLLTGLIRAAREEVERTTGLAMIEQGWRLALDRIPSSGFVLLRRGPVREITAVTAYGTDGEAFVLVASTYQFDPLSRPARLHFDTPPTDLRVLNGIEIDFTAGYGETPDEVPAPLRAAILHLVAASYGADRGEGGESPPAPDMVDRLLAPFERVRL